MQWLSAFYFLIKSAPQILEALVELKKLWDTYLDHDKKQEAMQMFGDSLNIARIRRDTGPLLDLVNNIIERKPLK